MPNDEGFDRYNMRYIHSPPWMRRAILGDYERPDAPFAGGVPEIPFEE